MRYARMRPDDGLLSEESKDTAERLDKSRVWIIDPVDGTREYGEGRADWAVHVGLSDDGDRRRLVRLPFPAWGGIVLATLISQRRFTAFRCAASGSQPDAPSDRGYCSGRGSGRRADTDGFGRRKGDGDRSRRSGNLSAFWRSI